MGISILEPEGLSVLRTPGDYLADLVNRGAFYSIPLVDWTTAFSGSGAAYVVPALLFLSTGATVSSVARAYGEANFSHGVTGTSKFNYDKDFRLILSIYRYISLATAIARIQIKAVTTEGVLANKGIGIQIRTLTLVGESYGTSLATTGSQVLTNDKLYHLEIRYSAGASIKWYVDRVLLATQSTAANIPSGTATGQMVFSIINGATATDAGLGISGSIIFWQED